jgi:hypothetical protein
MLVGTLLASACSGGINEEPSAKAMEGAYRASAEMDGIRAAFELFHGDLILSEFTRIGCSQSADNAWTCQFSASFTSPSLGQSAPAANEFLRKASGTIRSGTFFRRAGGQWQYQGG